MLFSDKKGREIAPPHNQALVADTHCHLTMLDQEGSGSGDRALFHGTVDALVRAAQVGIGFLVCVVDPTDDAEHPEEFFAQLDEWQTQAQHKLDELNAAASDADAQDSQGTQDAAAEKPAPLVLPKIRVAAGVHPHNAEKFTPYIAETLTTTLENPLVSAIGEIGLDYHYDFSPRDVQKEIFREQLRLAHLVELPVALHVREAHDDAYEILQEEGLPEAGCLLHCFNLGPEDILRFEELGCKFSIGGPVTFVKADEVRDAVATCKLSSLMTETDSPYMAPKPFRGTQCEPAFTVFTLDKIKEVRSERCGEDPQLIAQTLYQNALDFYDGKPATL